MLKSTINSSLMQVLCLNKTAHSVAPAVFVTQTSNERLKEKSQRWADHLTVSCKLRKLPAEIVQCYD